MTDTKFCKDCRWAVPARRSLLDLFDRKYPWAYAKCTNPATYNSARFHAYTEFLVSAEPQVFCSSARWSDAPCGPEGKLWEPKP